MNILALTPALPFPLDTGGKIRNYHILKGLAASHRVTLLSFVDSEREMGYREELLRCCQRVEVVRCPQRPKPIRFLHLLSTRTPDLFYRFCSRRMKERVQALLEKERFDLVHFTFSYMGQYAYLLLPGPMKVLDAHNVEYLMVHRMEQLRLNPLMRLAWRVEWPRVRRYELSLLRQMDCCLTVSEVDRQVFRSHLPDLRVSVFPNGVDSQYFSPQNTLEEPYLAFTGWMSYVSNVDGVDFFYREIFPGIRRVRPDVKFLVVGRDPDRHLLEMARSDPALVVTGAVEDVRPYLAKSQVVVVPLRVGSGTRLKILEAMAMGKPVVSTSLGCEGLEVCDGQEILVADTPQKFAAQVLDLLRNPEQRRQVGEKGRKLVQEKYEWQSIVKGLDRLYMRLLSERGSSAPGQSCA